MGVDLGREKFKGLSPRSSTQLQFCGLGHQNKIISLIKLIIALGNEDEDNDGLAFGS